MIPTSASGGTDQAAGWGSPLVRRARTAGSASAEIAPTDTHDSQASGTMSMLKAPWAR